MSDVLIIGGGIIGLACAVELAMRGAAVTILERDGCGHGASQAAAGMLAPEAEGLVGEVRELGLQSRSLYPQWIDRLMRLTGESCGFWGCGILALPSIIPEPNHPQWLDSQEIAQNQAGLSPEIEGAMWLPKDGQVDNLRLVKTLILAARSLSVKICEGENVYQIARSNHQVTHLVTSLGNLQADRYLLATGAWTRALLPLPVTPRKGQMLSVFDPERCLQRVIFSHDVYIVPRQDGRIIIGATVEDVGFMPGNTAAGILQLLSAAIAVYPAIANMNILDTWWGFRPYAPDEIPILGASDYENLALAVGHYRNGILLAPVTAQILADWLESTT